MPFPKPCKRCGKRFQPTGKVQRLCENCWKKAQNKQKLQGGINMKTHIKKEMKKHPYKKVRPLKKQSIIAQAIAYERRKVLGLNNYAIIDENNNIIDKFRLNNTAIVEMRRTERSFPGRLRVCRLDEHGKVGVVIYE